MIDVTESLQHALNAAKNRTLLIVVVEAHYRRPSLVKMPRKIPLKKIPLAGNTLLTSETGELS